MLMNKNHSVIKTVFIFSLCFSMAFASISVERTVPTTAKYGEEITISIKLESTFETMKTLVVRETITSARVVDGELVDYDPPEGVIASLPPFLEWVVPIPPHSSETISYTIIPDRVGTYFLSSTSVQTDDGETFFSEPVAIEIECNPNNICEPNIGEDVFSCPNDCDSGAEDTVCTPDRDGICDPDCTEGVDLDCVIQEETEKEAETEEEAEVPSPEPLEVGEAEDILLFIVGGVCLLLLVVVIWKIYSNRTETPSKPKTEKKSKSKKETSSVEGRLEELNDLLKEGIITKNEYSQQKKRILKEL